MATTVSLGNPFVGSLPMVVNYGTAYRFTPPFGTWAVGWRGKIEFTFTPDEAFPMFWIGNALLNDFNVVSPSIETIGASQRYVFDFAGATGDILYIQFYASGASGNCILDSVVYPSRSFWTSFKNQTETT